TYLVATDVDPNSPKVKNWSSDGDRGSLDDGDIRDKMDAWSKESGYVKFAVPLAAPGEVRVGNPKKYAHGEVAGGNALTAGLLYYDKASDTITEVENVSGGFRPGPLRNAIVMELLQ